MTSIENSQSSALFSSNVDVDDHLEKSASSLLNHGYMLALFVIIFSLYDVGQHFHPISIIFGAANMPSRISFLKILDDDLL